MKFAIGLLLLSLAINCSGGGTGGGNDPTATIPQNSGAILTQQISPSGVISGIPLANTKVVNYGSKGYSYAIVNINSELLGANRGQGYFAIAALLPDTDFGPTPTLGRHYYAGNYELAYSARTQSGGYAQPQNASGRFDIQLDLTSGTTSFTDYMSGKTSVITGSTLSMGDGVITGKDFKLEVSYNGTNGYVYGVFGQNGIAGAMIGESATGIYSGGIFGTPQ